MSERESMPCDVVIIGGGPAGLAAAIRLKQVAQESGAELEVIVLEKGSEIGAHILSGAVIDPRALDELLPEWRKTCSLAQVPVTEDLFYGISKTGHSAMPHMMFPPLMSNKGCYTGSLGNLTRWLAEQAEALGVMVFPGFPAAEVLFDEAGAVAGVVTQDMGVAADGSHKPDYQPGMEIHAKYTLFAEGARGNLTKAMKARFDLEATCQPQVYGLGIKEIWDIDPAQHVLGRIVHTQGWPLSESGSHGGGFLYHQAGGQVALGLVTWLDYKNPWVRPYEEFQRWKHHPLIAEVLKGGKRVAYGARAINDGGWQSVPKLAFPGGALIGCAAGFLNVPRIKGSHTAIKSGMLAAEAIAKALAEGRANAELMDYDAAVRSSWIATELKLVQNALPAIERFGDDYGTILGGIDMWMRYLKIGLPISMKHHRDYEMLERADLYKPIDYPKPDGILSFDRLTNVAYSYTNHAEDQPCHLKVKDMALQYESEYKVFAGPSQRYCPAGVYEWLEGADGAMTFQINSQNCVHCKTCDIKDPNQNIEWVTPEGGGGPNYPNM